MPKARQLSVRLERFRPFVRVVSDNLDGAFRPKVVVRRASMCLPSHCQESLPRVQDVVRNNLVGFTPQPFRLYIHDAVLRGRAFS